MTGSYRTATRRTTSLAQVLPSHDNSYFDLEWGQFVRGLQKSRHNLERSMMALDGIARANAAYQNIDSQVMGGRKALLSDD
jgi:hypothetical protein